MIYWGKQPSPSFTNAQRAVHSVDSSLRIGGPIVVRIVWYESCLNIKPTRNA